MASIKETRRALSELKAQLRGFVTKAEGEDLTEAEDSEASDLEKRIAKMEAQLRRMEASVEDEAEEAKEVAEEDEEAKGAKSLNRFRVGTQKSATVPRQKGSHFARYVIGKYMDQKYGFGAGAAHVEKHFGDMEVKATLTTAQPVIPQDFSKDVIDLLISKTAVRRSGVTVESMPMGQKDIPRERLGTTATWLGEGQDIATTANDYDMVRLSWKKLGAIASTTKELLEFSPIDVENRLINNLTNQMALTEDLTFLTSAGGQYTPRGIINLVAADNKINSSVDADGKITYETVRRDLLAAELKLKGKNVYGRYVWYVSPYVVSFLKSVQTPLGTTPFADELNDGKLLGYPVYETNQLASNVGAGADEAKLILACVDHLIIGDAYRMEVSTTDTGSFVEGGQVVNTFSRDLVAFKVTNSVDFNIMHDVSAAVIAAKGWNVGVTAPGIAFYTQAADTSGSNASSTKPRG